MSIPAIIGFVALILYTHLLSAAEYGIYVIGASIAGIVSAVFFAWVRLSVARYQAKSPELDLRARGDRGLRRHGCRHRLPHAGRVSSLFGRISALALWQGVSCCRCRFTAFEISQEFRRAQLNPLRYMTISVTRGVLGLAFGYAAIELGGGGLGLLFGIGASFLVGNILSFQGNAAKPLQSLSISYLKQVRPLRISVPARRSGLCAAWRAGPIERCLPVGAKRCRLLRSCCGPDPSDRHGSGLKRCVGRVPACVSQPRPSRCKRYARATRRRRGAFAGIDRAGHGLACDLC